MATPLTQEQRDGELQELVKKGWAVSSNGDWIEKTFKFGDFRAAIDWMVRLVPVCEEMDHHPEWKNVYSRVEVVLTTHDLGSLSNYDLYLAQSMEEIAG